jgi:tRNA (guanine-N7-)-methyltransferase
MSSIDRNPLKIGLTKKVPTPSHYIVKMYNDYEKFVLDETKAPQFKGKWRDLVFGIKSESQALDLEIGTGNGYFFAHHCKQNPDRNLIGLEIKYKPLVQTIQRAVRAGSENMRVARYHASLVKDLFKENELNNVFIYFPDPWPKKRAWKNRLITEKFLTDLYELQKPESFVEFKTDNFEYFEWARERFEKSAYSVQRMTYDLHASEYNSENYITGFEELWTSKGFKIHLLRATKL